ncbi:MAG: class I SAM-dependent methyltransferase [Pseudomonadota bacterium]|uniref:class I SAM-dependent methyltransferase n=1 Tax=Fodinicurvata fenggangensis TaxID=1121830 RepID=UPI00047E531E|nr:methyltransferase [Fodinicurvata fenggangensis]
MDNPERDPSVARAFVRNNTAIETPTLVPEIPLHLASKVMPLWHATEEELEQMEIPPPYWAFAWAGGQALTRFLLDNPDRVRGKRVLDFAAGSGLSAIAAARCGAREVVASEIDPLALAAIQLNAELNQVQLHVMDEDFLGRGDGAWDLLLAGDVCYEQPMADRAFAWLAQQAAAGADVLMGDPGRSYLPAQGLEALAVYRVPTNRELEDSEVRRTTVWRILPSEGD